MSAEVTSIVAMWRLPVRRRRESKYPPHGRMKMGERKDGDKN